MNDDVYIHTRTYHICTCIYTCMLWHICMIYIHICTNIFSHWYTYNTRTLSRLRILNAKANHIVLLPDMLGLKSLQNLNISDNDLEYINASVQGLSALTVSINKYVCSRTHTHTHTHAFICPNLFYSYSYVKSCSYVHQPLAPLAIHTVVLKTNKCMCLCMCLCISLHIPYSWNHICVYNVQLILLNMAKRALQSQTSPSNVGCRALIILQLYLNC